MKATPKKIIKPRTAKVDNGWIRCPRCGRAVAKAYYGAACRGIEIKCRCDALVRIELQESRQ